MTVSISGAILALDLSTADDRDLLAAHCEGHPDAFGELFRRHRNRMWAVALRLSGDREAAADAVQEAFLSAFRRADSYRGEAKVTTWLHRIVVNAALDRLRRVQPTTDIDAAPSAALAVARDAPDELGTELAVRAALLRLPPGQRAALVLIDMHSVPVAEAAQMLGVAEGTVKSRCARGRAALRPLLADVRGPG